MPWTLKASAKIFPDVAADFASGGYDDDWQGLGRGFINQTIPEEEEEQEHFLMTCWSGPAKHLQHLPVSPNRTRSLSLESDLPGSFLFRSAALEDLTAVGDKIRESEGISVSEEFLPEDSCIDSTERGNDEMQQTVAEHQKTTEFGEKDIPNMAVLHCSNDNLAVDTSSEYNYADTTPKQDFDNAVLLTQGDTQNLDSVSVRDSYLELHKGSHCDFLEDQGTQLAHYPGSPETEGKEVIPPLKDSTSSPVSSYGSPTRKSRVPVSQFKGL